jgi:hypothetical protein
MKISRTTFRIGAVLGTIAAFVALAGSAQGATWKPAGMSDGEYRSLMLRSEALGHKYGLGPQTAVPEGMTAAEYRKLMLRSEALNKRYGLDKQETAAVTSRPTNSTRGFPWGAFGIGAAVMFGLALLAGGFFARRRLLATLPRARTTP